MSMIQLVDPKSSSSCPTALDIEREVEVIYERHSAELLSYASSFVRREDSAFDAVQEAFLRYFVERSYGRVIDNPRGWLYRVLRNYLLDRLDRAALKREIPAAEVLEVPDPGQSAEAAVARAQAAGQVASQFSGRELQCLKLRAAGATYDEIAECLGIRSGTVSCLLTRVHKKLRGSGGGRLHVPTETLGGLCFLFSGGEP